MIAFYGSVCDLLLFETFLFLAQLFLLFLQGCEASRQSAGTLSGVGFIGAVVGFKFFKKLLVVSCTTKPPHAQSTAKQRNKVVVVQARAVFVEHEEEEHWHEEHHPLHHLHLLCLFAAHCVALLAHGHVRVYEVRAAEEEAEEAEVVANQRQVGAPRKQTVVSAKVVGPEETFLSEFDGIRHKVEHSNPDRHLY